MGVYMADNVNHYKDAKVKRVMRALKTDRMPSGSKRGRRVSNPRQRFGVMQQRSGVRRSGRR